MGILIKNGLIYDGTGAAPFKGSVFIEDDRIKAVIKDELAAGGETGPDAVLGNQATSGAVLGNQAASATRLDKEANLYGGTCIGENSFTSFENVETVIDACGRCVTPGFIDQHRHADLAIFRESFGPQELAQGLTTIGTGVCGFSYAPFTDKSEGLYTYAEPIMGPSADGARYATLAEYIDAARHADLSINAATLQGLGAIRIAVKGYDPSPYTKEEMEKGQALVEDAINAGVRGFSTGLIYNPEMYTSTEEMTELLKPCKGRNMLFMPHMRSEANELPEAVSEVIHIAEENEMVLSISHFKAMGPENWHVKLEDAISRIEAARNRGMDVTVDVYPYHGTSTTLSSALPFSFLNEPFEKIIAKINRKDEIDRLKHCYLNPGPKDNKISPDFRWSTTLITGVALPENEKYLSKSVKDAFAISGYSDIYEFIANLLYSEKGSVCMVELAMDEADVERIMKLPYSMIISDTLYTITDYPHPRAYAMCPHMIKEYVLNRKVLPLETAIKKMTSMQAERMHYTDRGLIKEGAYADVLIFDPENLKDNATFEKGKVLSGGIDYAFVNGVLSWKDEKQLAKAGRYLI
ncbi:MAG: amidohydrolase family protein [Lachnospiraceae bacterium]|nr:amidohydrolase family protein [Lachnospiraceae bacterium]